MKTIAPWLSSTLFLVSPGIVKDACVQTLKVKCEVTECSPLSLILCPIEIL